MNLVLRVLGYFEPGLIGTIIFSLRGFANIFLVLFRYALSNTLNSTANKV